MRTLNKVQDRNLFAVITILSFSFFCIALAFYFPYYLFFNLDFIHVYVDFIIEKIMEI